MNTPTGFFTYRPLVEATAARYGYDAALLAAQAHQESGFRADAVSHAGAEGLMQFMPETWAEVGKGKSPFDPAANLDAGVRYMLGLLEQFQDVRIALAAYNYGAGNVARVARKAGSWAWEKVSALLPKETQEYVPSILSLRRFYAAAYGLAKAALPGALVVVLALAGVVLVRRIA